jgi:hypothetical protein
MMVSWAGVEAPAGSRGTPYASAGSYASSERRSGTSKAFQDLPSREVDADSRVRGVESGVFYFFYFVTFDPRMFPKFAVTRVRVVSKSESASVCERHGPTVPNHLRCRTAKSSRHAQFRGRNNSGDAGDAIPGTHAIPGTPQFRGRNAIPGTQRNSEFRGRNTN